MVSKRKIIILFYYLLILSSFFLNQEMSTIIALVGSIICNNSISVFALRFLKYPIFIVFLGFIYSFINPLDLVLKDIFYFVSPLIIFYFGFNSSKLFDFSSYLKHTIFLGVLLGVYFIFNFSFSSMTLSISQLKEEQGLPSYISILCFSLLVVIQNKFKFFNILYYRILFLFFLFIILFSFSRTFLIVSFILLVFGFGLYRINSKSFFKLFTIIALFLFFISSLVNLNNFDRKTFVGKITTTLDEMVISDYSTKSEINNNWRGFEAYKGLEQFSKSSVYQFIFGQGFGRSAPLGFSMPLGDSEFNEIPKFHNGYVTIILKTGILGLIFYLIFIFKILTFGFKNYFDNDVNKLYSDFIFGLGITLFFTTFVISGWLNKMAFIPFLFSLGYLISLKSYFLKN